MTVGEAEVVVMKGEYSYIGVDGNEWKVSTTHFSQDVVNPISVTMIMTVDRLSGTQMRQDSTQAPPSSPSLWNQTTLRWPQR